MSGWSGEVTDTVCRAHGSLLQHGPYNDRIYVMRCGEDIPRILAFLRELAEREGYTKTVAKVRSEAAELFFEAGFRKEAMIPGLFQNEDCLFLSHFSRPERMVEPERAGYDVILDRCRETEERRVDATLPEGYSLHRCGREHAGELARLYDAVFPSYPFPINDPAHIMVMMEDTSRFYGVSTGGTIVAVSSAEVDTTMSSVEMTDFATHPDHRGKRLAAALLGYMEEEMMMAGMRNAYTIARADSLPISVIFARAGYRYGGRLVNNTNICGSLRSMNVWYRAF